MNEERRGFLRSLMAGTVAGVATVIGRRAGAQHEAHGMPPMNMPPPSPQTGEHGTHTPSGVTTQRLPKGAPPADSTAYKRFKLELQVLQQQLAPGVVVHMMGFNGRVPGPTIRVREGDWVWVDFTNASDEMHTIHWHGVNVNDYRMDGVPYMTQDPIMRGEKYPYVFRAEPYGTHFYHCHFGTVMHMQSGMFGAFIIERDDDPIRKRFPYREDYTLILSSHDTVFLRAQMNGMFARMRERDVLGMRNRLDLPTQSRFAGIADLIAAVKRGYVPPYLKSRTSPEPPNPNFFTINGRSYPATEAISVREGEWTRIRFINAGNVDHRMHLHGHDFYVVAVDGSPLDSPTRQNTVGVPPGNTLDIVFLADNPGVWALHDHYVAHTTNNGVYPGGVMTDVAYEGFDATYKPTISLDE